MLLCLGPAVARAQSGPDDQYVGIFSLIEQADLLAASGQAQSAQAQYQAALTALQQFAAANPYWGTNIVAFREQYLADKIAATPVLPTASDATNSTVVAGPTPMPSPMTNVPPNTTPVAKPAAEADAAVMAQLAALRSQVDNLEAGNATLGIKLREALTAQPAAVDPQELAAAQAQVRSLMKENALLRVSLDRPQHSPADAWLVESNALAQAQASLADMTRQLSQARALATQLTAENQALQARGKSGPESADSLRALREENDLLKKQLAAAQASARQSVSIDQFQAVQADLATARAEIETLKAAARQSESDKAALADRVRVLESAKVPLTVVPVEQTEPVAPMGPAPLESPVLVTPVEGLATSVTQALAEDAMRIHDLVLERDRLKLQLMAARQLWGGNENRAATNALVAQLSTQLKTLQDRLAVVEAQRVPFTSEELAWFRLPAPAAKPASSEKQVLAALARSPEDASSLAALGRLRLLQEDYEGALDILGRAARLDPRSADIQVWLGLALGQQGLRLPAETAFRQALQLDPDNATAHHNLAVIYISEQPPRADLARSHYLQALAAGEPRTPGLEQLLANNHAAVPGH